MTNGNNPFKFEVKVLSSVVIILLDLDHKLKNPKKLEAIFLETFMATNPGRLKLTGRVMVMANRKRKRRGRCFAPKLKLAMVLILVKVL